MSKISAVTLLIFYLASIACSNSNAITNLHNLPIGTSTITGSVVNEIGEAMIGVRVDLESYPHKEIQSTFTDKHGWFAFRYLPAGNAYKVTAVEPGYPTTGRSKLALRAFTTLNVPIVLVGCNNLPIIPGFAPMIDYKQTGGHIVYSSTNDQQVTSHKLE